MRKYFFLSIVLALIFFSLNQPAPSLAAGDGWSDEEAISHEGFVPSTATFGLSDGNADNTESSNRLHAMRFQNTAGTGLLNKLELLVNDSTPNDKVRMGVYSDSNGKPGVCLLDAGETNVTNGWISISGLSLPVSAGTYYWLAYNLQNRNTVQYQSGQPSHSHYWSNASYGVLPADFQVAASNSNNRQYVMRATVAIDSVLLQAVDDAYSVNASTTLNVAAPGVLANDSGRSPLTSIRVSGPAHGSLSLDTNGSFVYTSTANYVGPDLFTYRANDSTADSNIATVNITINALPISPATQVRVETSASGGGNVVPAQTLNPGNRITVFSITRDAKNNFIANTPPDSWVLAEKTGGIEDKDLIVAPNGSGAAFIAHKTGTVRIRIRIAGLASVDSGLITVADPLTSPPSPPDPGTGESGGTGSSDKVFLFKYMTDTPGTFSSEFNTKTWDGRLKLTFPKGTTGKTEEGWALSYISLDPIAKDGPDVPSLDKGNIIGFTYNLEPEGTTFRPPAIITILYTDAMVPAGVNEKDLVIGFWNSNSKLWEVLAGCLVDTVKNQITAPLSHFSSCAILSLSPKAAPASFSVGNLSISPSEVISGQEVTISTTVANTGGSAGSYTVSLKLNGIQTESRDLILDSGKTENLAFKTWGDKPGLYQIELNGQIGQFTVKESGGKIAELVSNLLSSPKPTSIVSPTQVAAEKPVVSSNPATTSPASPDKWIVVLGVILAITIAGSVVLILGRKTA
jgi:hypothetical protein